MQIRKIIPSVVENKNATMRNKLNSFQNLEGGPLLFSILGIIYFTNYDYVVLVCIFPSTGNYFSLISPTRWISLVQKSHFVSQKP